MDNTTYKTDAIAVTGDFWMEYLKACAAISYVCYNKPAAALPAPSGSKNLDGIEYEASVEALTPDLQPTAPDNRAKFIRFSVTSKGEPANVNQLHGFAKQLIHQLQRIKEENLQISTPKPKDFEVHKPNCNDPKCEGCDE